MSDAIGALRRATAPGAEAAAIARLGREPATIRMLDQFRKAVATAKDLDTALRDPRVLNVLLPALGLPDAVGQPGLARRALTADPAAPDGLLSKLADQRWRSAAQTLNFKEKGLDALRDPKLLASLGEGLTRLAWNNELDATNPGVGDALLFQNRAARAKTTFELLGDPVLRRVVTGALGLPAQIVVQSVEAQARAVEARLDVKTLQNPRAVAKLAERYVIAEANTAASQGFGATGPNAWVVGLLQKGGILA